MTSGQYREGVDATQATATNGTVPIFHLFAIHYSAVPPNIALPNNRKSESVITIVILAKLEVLAQMWDHRTNSADASTFDPTLGPQHSKFRWLPQNRENLSF
jgi:hypothetical protein